MDSYTVMLVVDAKSPVRRFQVAKSKVKRIALGVLTGVLVLAVGLWDYVRVRADNADLDRLRVEVAEQHEQIRDFEDTLGSVNSELAKVRELERKIRIIANLPGAAGVGGAGVTELVPPMQPGAVGEAELLPPAGVPVDLAPFGPSVPPAVPAGSSSQAVDPVEMQREGLTTSGAQRVNELERVASSLGSFVGERGESLSELLGQLENKRNQLASMPSVWPTKGWLTSRFGVRISPFTGRPQRHAGIDIAARAGTEINSPARGRVASISNRGPLGNSLTVDHGYGVKTFYGHTEKIFVKVGEQVERGQQIASVGSTGRSTGPHLHYGVHVRGKPADPLDYIFD
jgi:murein DD-endopeptidase MepM/ murein hydrolase activator NlpD